MTACGGWVLHVRAWYTLTGWVCSRVCWVLGLDCILTGLILGRTTPSPRLATPDALLYDAAGAGLFLRGEARPGAVVAIFPGVLYGRTQLALMPNFPKASAVTWAEA